MSKPFTRTHLLSVLDKEFVVMKDGDNLVSVPERDAEFTEFELRDGALFRHGQPYSGRWQLKELPPKSALDRAKRQAPVNVHPGQKRRGDIAPSPSPVAVSTSAPETE